MPTAKTSFSTSFSLPSGFQELEPSTLRQRRRLEMKLLDLFGRYGFEEVDVASLEYEPLYEPTRMGHDLFHHLITGRISERRDFDLDGHRAAVRTVVLRPDFIAPLARRFITEALASGWPRYLPLRWSYVGQVFRNLQAQGGRRREFRQLGAVLIGAEHRLANVEVLTLIADAAAAIGLPKWELRIGHSGLYDALLGAIGVPETVQKTVSNALKRYVRSHHKAQRSADAFLDWAEKDAPDTSRLLREQLRLKDQQIKAIMSLVNLRGGIDEFEAAVEPYRDNRSVSRLVDGLKWHAEQMRKLRDVALYIDPAARSGAGYFDGLTMELFAGRDERRVNVGAGGRYASDLYEWVLEKARATQALRADGASAELSEGHGRLTGVGFVFGLERVLEVLTDEPPGGGVDIFVCTQKPELASDAFAFASRLRAKHCSACVHIPRQGEDRLGDQLGRAKYLGARYAVIFAQSEHKEGRVAIKTMADGSQSNYSLEEAEAFLIQEPTR